MSTSGSPAPTVSGGGTAREVFVVFLRLGLTSFGGPVAHLGYFRDAFVVRRRWLGDRAYADLVALCQFLPGPASSQVGMAIGLRRAGIGGLLAAWAGFTLPSAVLLVVFAYGVTTFGGDAGAGWIGGLKAAAVAVVAHAVLGMARTLAPDARRATIVGAAAIATLLAPSVLGLPVVLSQVGVIVLSGAAGLLWLAAPPDDGDDEPFPVPVRRSVAVACLAVFGALLVALPLLAAAWDGGVTRLVDIFYRAGALVFGGGHVVLPLLQAELVPSGLVGHDQFLAGYGAAQAVPGPLFTFAAYLGAVTTSGPTGIAGAAIALLAIFVPSALLVVGGLPFWERLRSAPRARRALTGVNAGVVGLLAAALYDPVLTQGVLAASEPLVALALAIAAFVALAKWSAPPWAVVMAAGLLGWAVL
ncbi:chromate transporter [Promicromonospora umidemergens]|uniref:Chromate efflux transporter n=1 Tax=Promicromonospora umidemergens TaxID=629679 RepID=A0ABP8XP19_9MICO|nr:chromate efflux transporter [Promicromonospora umidemergens]MCP2282112.1 chromate transporter [Promicromonospora umidemergens]